MTTSESKGRFFLQNKPIRIANWNALAWCAGEQWRRQGLVRRRAVFKGGVTGSTPPPEMLRRIFVGNIKQVAQLLPRDRAMRRVN